MASKKKGTVDTSAAANRGDLNVEESNALREKLGIKPLKEGAKEAEGSSKNPVDIHDKKAKASGPTEADTKRGKAAAKNKKEHEELTTGEGLADILAREEGTGGAAEWIAKSRNADGTMRGAATAAASKERADKGEPPAKKRKGDDKMPAMKVRHDQKDIDEAGGSVTMVLSDQPLLDKDGKLNDSKDELSNVRFADNERAKHNDEVRNQKEYDPTKEGQEILSKYNELQTGPKGFSLASGGAVIDEADPEKKLAMLTAMSEKHSLDNKLKLQSDYYTAEEMNKMNKSRKPPKKKTKRSIGKDKVDKEDQIGGSGPTGTAAAGRPADAGSDEEDPELYEQLSKQRRLVRRSDAGTIKKGEAALSAVSDRIQNIDGDEAKLEEKEKAILGNKKEGAENIAMTATTEFCNVVQTPLEKVETLKHEAFRGSTLYKQQVASRKGIKMSRQKQNFTAEDDLGNVGDRDDEGTNLAEDGLDLTAASGLAYLRARAQIGLDQDTHKNRKSDNRPLEMSTLDGDIKLEYRDDYGRVQTPKEAFRAISWKFHGKVPGRKNMERRLLRLEHEMKLKSMNPVEQLPTLRALRHVQKTDAKPYMALSGANEK